MEYSFIIAAVIAIIILYLMVDRIAIMRIRRKLRVGPVGDNYYIKIGGTKHLVSLKYEDTLKILRFYNRHLTAALELYEKQTGHKYNWETDTLPIGNYVFFQMLYKLLEKRGVWPFKKPFRSFRHMCKSIEKDEVEDMVYFINVNIFDMPVKEDKQKGNERQGK